MDCHRIIYSALWYQWLGWGCWGTSAMFAVDTKSSKVMYTQVYEQYILNSVWEAFFLNSTNTTTILITSSSFSSLSFSLSYLLSNHPSIHPSHKLIRQCTIYISILSKSNLYLSYLTEAVVFHIQKE